MMMMIDDDESNSYVRPLLQLETAHERASDTL